MCRYTAPLEKDTSYNGDRILVNKFAYQIAEPQRWDVIVFKYPGDPLTDPPSPTDRLAHQLHQAIGRAAGRHDPHPGRRRVAG